MRSHQAAVTPAVPLAPFAVDVDREAGVVGGERPLALGVAAVDKVFKLGLPALIESGAWPGDHPFVVLAPQYGVAEAAIEAGPRSPTTNCGRSP
jgi:hypothetical protein